jgi:hypothetical protein
MGYGFVEFESKESSMEAIKKCARSAPLPAIPCHVLLLYVGVEVVARADCCGARVQLNAFALRRLQGAVLDEHALQLKLSTKKLDCTQLYVLF